MVGDTEDRQLKAVGAPPDIKDCLCVGRTESLRRETSLPFQPGGTSVEPTSLTTTANI